MMFGRSCDFLSLVGVLALLYGSTKLALWFIECVRAYILSTPKDLKKYGAWAVVTGSTDGIGKAYAEQLAAQGINIVLISRSQAKLDDVAKEIEQNYSVKTQTIAIDFCGGREIYDVARSRLMGLDIGVLVNNVGMSTSHPEYFLDVPDREKFYSDMINVNITSCTLMTSVVLPGMVEKKKGVIINVGSLAGVFPMAFMSVYSSTKAYVKFFSQALRNEYESKGIIVQACMPGMVATKMSKIRKASFAVPSPTTFVKSALGTVGFLNVSCGVLAHALQDAILLNLPERLVANILGKEHLSMRERALKKKKST